MTFTWFLRTSLLLQLLKRSTHCILGAWSDTVMLWMIRVMKAYNMSQHWFRRGQALILSCASSIALLPMTTDSTWLLIFHCCGHLTWGDGWGKKEGSEGKGRVTILSKPLLRLTGQTSLLKTLVNTIWKVLHPTRH